MARKRNAKVIEIKVGPERDQQKDSGRTLGFPEEIDNAKIASNLQDVSSWWNGGDPDQDGLLERYRGIPKNENNDDTELIEQPDERMLFKQGIDDLTEEQFANLREIVGTSSLGSIFETHVGPSVCPSKINEVASQPKPDLPKVAPALWSERTTGREVSPADFVRSVYSEWLGHGLMRSHIAELDYPLYQAFAKWVKRHPEDDGLLPKKTLPTDNLSDDEKKKHKRSRAAENQRNYVARKMSMRRH